MTIQEKVQSTSPCGLDCFNCPSHENNITEKLKAALAAFYKKDPSTVSCKGCRAVKGQCLFTGDCPTYACIRAKGVEYCYECGEFPCPMLAPAVDRADKFPHNYKLYNLCRIKAVGVEKWVAEEADSVRQLYFKGQLIPGLGAVERKES